MTPLVRLDAVGRDYPGGVRALHHIDLEIGRGELLAVVGPSGSGKSTLLQLMGTLDVPTRGRVVIDGYDIGALSDGELSALRAQRIGFVFQQFHLAAGRSVIDNVADGLLYTGQPRSVRRARAIQALHEVGLERRLTHVPEKLSGGERQRAAIARAVVGRPALLLADEPTGNLDTANGAGVLALLRGLHEQGTTVVVITHDREMAARMPRQVQLRDGMVVADIRTSALSIS